MVIRVDEGKRVGLIGNQFGAPSGLLGRVASRFMARNNGEFNEQLVNFVATVSPRPRVVAELGFGPGVGLAALLNAFPDALVFGADPSPAVMRQAVKRNRGAVRSAVSGSSPATRPACVSTAQSM